MKKVLAILLALALVVGGILVFTGCGKDEPTEAASETTTEDLFADMGGEEETEAQAADETTAAPETNAAGETVAPEETKADETTAAPETNAEGETVAPADTTAATAATTKAAEKGLTSSNAAEVVAFYNKAVIDTNKAGAPNGQSKMKLDGEIGGDGAIGTILGILQGPVDKALTKNSTPTDYIPGKGKLQASDVTKAQAAAKNGVTTIALQVKDQKDGPDGDPENGGPVARAIGTLGSIENALKELGATLTSGRDTVTLTYANAYVKCTVNEAGKITSGTWHYLVKVLVGNAKAKLGISVTLENLHANIDYTVTI